MAGRFVEGTEGDDILVGSEGPDHLYGFGGTDTLSGLGDDDWIYPGQGGRLTQDNERVFETVDAGAGNDHVLVDWSAAHDPAYHRVSGGDGIDRLYFDIRAMNEAVDWILDDQGRPVGAAFLTSYRLEFDGIERIVFHGSAGDDSITGVSDIDILWGYGGSDTLRGADGEDFLRGGEGVDRLYGDAGDDHLYGGPGLDEMYGGEGDDEMEVDERGESAFGGPGIDTVLASVSQSLRADTENLRLGGLESINGSGNSLDNMLRGNWQSNILSGLDGDDLLDGWLGADTLRGGFGDDTYIVDNRGDRVQESSAAGGTDTVRSEISWTLGTNVENLALTGEDRINGTGNHLANLLTGNTTGNVLSGLGGNDVIRGNAGVDRLKGGAGNDQLWGGKGGDFLEGGDGADRFYFNAALASDDRDVIEVFNRAADLIYLDDAIFSALGAGALPASAFRAGPNAADASDRIIYHASTGNIFYDSDGAGGAEKVLFATVDPGLALNHTDLVVF